MNNNPDSELIEFKGLLSFLILHELKRERLYGEQLAQHIGGRKGETLTPGTIYPALKRLRKHKLIKYSRNGRKKIYFLTDDGKTELKKLYKVFGRYFKGLRVKIPKERKNGVKKKTKRKILKKSVVKKKVAKR